MILIFKLIVLTAFLIPATLVVFKLIVGIRLAAEGRRESDFAKTKRGRTTALNALIAFLLLAVVAWFVFSEFISLEL